MRRALVFVLVTVAFAAAAVVGIVSPDRGAALFLWSLSRIDRFVRVLATFRA
jgi:hypothetical protein